MAALKQACTTSGNIKNTGVDCSTAMAATAMLIFMPKGTKWQLADELDFDAFLMVKLYAALGLRWYPIFGNQAPIREINNEKEGNVFKTFDDGSKRKIRDGIFTFTLTTDEGGLCLANSLYSLAGSGMDFIEVDVTGKVGRIKNADGSLSGYPTQFIDASLPTKADLKSDVFSVSLTVSVYRKSYIGMAAIMSTTSDIASYAGLLDVMITDATLSSPTKIKIGVSSLCGGSDLVVLYGSQLVTGTSMFTIANKLTGAAVPYTSAAIVGGHIELTGTFTSATSYIVSGATAAVWFAALITGQEAIQSVVISIP